MAQHRGELLRIHLAVMGPGRFVLRAGVWIGAERCCGAVLACGGLALAWTGGGIGAEFVIAEIVAGCRRLAAGWRRCGGFWCAEQIALQCVVLGLGSGPRHRLHTRNRIVPSLSGGARRQRRSTISCWGEASWKPSWR